MRIVPPQEITESVLQSTNVVNDEIDWVAGTYNLGDKRVYNRRVYEVVVASTTDQPDVGAAADPPSWILLGWSNKWRMFTEGQDSQSTGTGDIDVTLQWPSSITTLAVLGVMGSSVTVTVTDSVDGVVYDQTIDLVDIGALEWWEWYFLPYDFQQAAVFSSIPPYAGADVRILIEGASPSDPVAAGRAIAGIERTLGVTQYGTDVAQFDYSTKERDGFGNLVLVPRRAINIVDFDVHVMTPQVDFVSAQLKKLAGIPALYIGADEFSSTVVYGVQVDVSQGITWPSISELTLRVEEF